MKKILALVLALSLILSASALAAGEYHTGGTGTFYTTEKPICEETKTYTVMAQKASDSCDWEDMWCFDYIRDELGIDFEFTCVDDSIWEEKLNLAFQADTVPDLFLNGLSAKHIVTYGADYFLDLKDLIAEYAPLVQKVFDTYPDIVRGVTSENGAIYNIPKSDMLLRDLTRHRPYMNVKWLENLGLERPETIDDLYDILLAFKEKDADGDGDPNNEIAFAGRFEGEWNKYYMLSAFGFANDQWDLDKASEGSEVFYVPAHENYYAFLEYMHKLWADGIIDPEFFSQTNDQLVAKESSVMCGFFSTWGANWTLMPDEANYSQYTMISPVTSPVNDTKIWPAKAGNLSYAVSISNMCEDPIPLVKFANWLYSIEGEIVVQYGPELGEMDEVNGWEWVLNDEGYACMQVSFDKDAYTSYNNFRIQKAATMRLPFNNTPIVYEDAHNENGDPIPMNFYTLLNKTQVILTNDTLNAGLEYYTQSYPDFIMVTEAENARIAQLDTDIKAYKDQMTAKFIKGEEELTEASFAAYIDGLKARGLDELVQIKQQIYDRYLGR